MKRIVFCLLTATCVAFSAAGFCWAEDESAAESNDSVAEESAAEDSEVSDDSAEAEDSAEADSESGESAETTAETDDGRDDTDPLESASDTEIPLSFYIGGGVIAAFLVASVVVLILGKKDKK